MNGYVKVSEAREFMLAAAADGWSIEPTYEHESVETAARLRKDGFLLQITCRPSSRYGTVHAWGPDGLAVHVGKIYSMETILANAEKCANCGGPGGTERYSFAGRCCKDCLPRMRATHEKPGWCD